MFLSDTPGWIVSTIHNLSTQLSGGESMAKGLITVGIMGALVAVLRGVPTRIWLFIKQRLTVSICSDGACAMNIYLHLQDFILQNRAGSAIKYYDYSIRRNRRGITIDYSVGIDVGSGMFFYRGRPFWYVLENAKEHGSVPSKVTLTTLSLNKSYLKDLLKITDKLLSIHGSGRSYFVNEGSDWMASGKMEASPAIFLEEKLKAELDAKIDFFRDNRAWYTKRGLTYKLIIILHGPPGTGKSRIARYVADRLGYSLGSMQSSTSFQARLHNASRRNIVVSIPDFDAAGLATRRAGMKDEIAHLAEETPKGGLGTAQSSGMDKVLALFDSGTLVEVLNTLEGDIPLNNCVVVMSTNCIDQIDPALLRPSRCDMLIEVKALGYTEVNAFYQHFYETTADLPLTYHGISIPAADLMGAFKDHPFDPKTFISELLQYVPAGGTSLEYREAVDIGSVWDMKPSDNKAAFNPAH